MYKIKKKNVNCITEHLKIFQLISDKPEADKEGKNDVSKEEGKKMMKQ